MEMSILVNASVDIEDPASTDWEDKAACLVSDPCTNATLKRALADALEQDPAAAVKDAETVYRIMIERALAQPSREWKWRTQPTWCWVCNSHNTRLMGTAGHGIVHECLDCGDQFLIDGAIQWAE